MLKRFLNLFVFASCLTFSINAHSIELLTIPLEDGGKILYSLAVNKKTCDFESKQKVNVTSFDKSGIENLDFFEKLYFDTQDVKIEKTKISFQIKAASNMTFEFTNNECKLKKSVKIENKTIFFEKIKVQYKSPLAAPVLESMSLCSDSSNCTKIYPYELAGHLPIYELNAGLGLSVRNNLRPSNRARFMKNNPILEPMPVFLFRYGNFFLNKDGFGTALATYKGALLLGTLMYDGEKFESQTYDERKKGIFLGPIFKWEFLQVQYMRDYLERKRGEELKVTLEYEFRPRNNMIIKPRVYAQFWNKKYNDNYFGVKSHEDSSNVYRPGSGINWSAMTRALIHDKKITYVADFGVKFLDSEVYRSSIITKKYELRSVLGILYKIF